MNRTSRGFTLIEMGVVIMMLVLFAVLIVPNVLTMKTAQAQRAAYGTSLDLFKEARVDAIKDNTTYAVGYDAGSSQIRLLKQPQEDNQTVGSQLPSPDQRPLANVQSVSDLEQVKAFSLPDPIKGERFQVGQTSPDGGSWVLHFYPDGTSEGGGIELHEGVQVSSISVDKNGIAQFQKDPLTDPSQLSWPSGTYVDNGQP